MNRFSSIFPGSPKEENNLIEMKTIKKQGHSFFFTQFKNSNEWQRQIFQNILASNHQYLNISCAALMEAGAESLAVIGVFTPNMKVVSAYLWQCTQLRLPLLYR